MRLQNQDLGHEKKFLPACNAAVIMIRGFCKSWKQLVAYYLLNSTFNEVDIQNVVQQVIRKLQNIGLKNCRTCYRYEQKLSKYD